MSLFIFSFDYLRNLQAAWNPGKNRILVVAFLFVVICLGSLSLLRSVFYFDNFQVMAVNTLSPATRVIGLGSSRMFFDIDPRMMPGQYVSLATNYLDMSGASRLWQLHSDRLPGVRQVFIEFGLSTLYYDMYELSPQALQPLGLDVRPAWSDVLRRPDYAIRLLLAPVFRWRLTPAFLETQQRLQNEKEEPLGEVAGFVPSKVKLVLPDIYAERKVAQTREHLKLFVPSVFSSNMAALIHLVRDLKSKGIRVVLIRFPKEEHVWPVYDPDWNKKVNEAYLALTGAVGATEFMDFSRDLRFVLADFRDPDHLNQDGARRLSGILSGFID